MGKAVKDFVNHFREAITLLKNTVKRSKVNIFSIKYLIFIFPTDPGIPYPMKGLLNQKVDWRREDFGKTGGRKTIIVIAVIKERDDVGLN